MTPPSKAPWRNSFTSTGCPEDREQEYAKLLEACRPPAKPATAEAQAAREQVAEKAIQLDYQARVIGLRVQSGWKARPLGSR